MLKFTSLIAAIVMMAALPLVAAVEPFDPQPSPWGEGSSKSEEYHGAYLGIDSRDVTADRVAPLKLKEEQGVEITMVDQDAPAGKIGLREHDVILEFNGTRVESIEQLRRLIHEVPAGRTVSMLISRDGQPLTLQVQLADRAKKMAKEQKEKRTIVIPDPPDFEMPEMPEMPTFSFAIQTSSRAGVLVENLTPQLGDFFGVRNAEGVLVRSVEKGSPAEAAGLKAGDVIVRVGNDKIGDRGDWRAAIRNHPSGKVAIGIVRDKREQSLWVTMPQKSKDQSEIRFNPAEVMVDPQQIRVEAEKNLPLIKQQVIEELNTEPDSGSGSVHSRCHAAEKADAEAESQDEMADAHQEIMDEVQDEMEQEMLEVHDNWHHVAQF